MARTLQRKKTLLKEFEEKDRAGGIVDRRFGENDPAMAPEERMLERAAQKLRLDQLVIQQGRTQTSKGRMSVIARL